MIEHPTESQVLAHQAKAEYLAMTPEEQAEVDARWEAMSEYDREQLQAAIEFDLL